MEATIKINERDKQQLKDRNCEVGKYRENDQDLEGFELVTA